MLSIGWASLVTLQCKYQKKRRWRPYLKFIHLAIIAMAASWSKPSAIDND